MEYLNITFLIGNGFDISLGIQSSYAKFYEWYCDKPSIVGHITAFRKNIKDDVNSNVPDEDKTWADFEVGLGKYTTNFDKKTVEQYLSCLEDAQENIVEYLNEQKSKLDLNSFTEESYSSFKKSISNFWEEVADLEKPDINNSINEIRNENRIISFLTFNYTDTLEQILERFPDDSIETWRYGGSTYSYRMNRDVIHLHGTTEHFPVLGVNDDNQIEKKELLDTPQFREFLLKPENVRALGEVWHQKAETQLAQSRFVCVLGSSLGKTDAKWWIKLVDWLRKDPNRHIILYWFEKNISNNISSIRRLRCKNQAKELLLSYSNILPKEAESLKNRIHVVINTQKFLKLEKKIEEINFADSTSDGDIAPVLVK